MGLETAASNLRRYRSGKGGARHFGAREIEEHPVFLDAEDENRTRFESGTFVGKTGEKDVREKLLNLKPGETTKFDDRWDVDIGFVDALANPDTYFAFGRSGVRSTGAFTAKREGDDIMITGTVTHGFDPKDAPYNFDPGQLGHADARVLESRGEGAPFEMKYQRKQDSEALVRRGPGDQLTLKRATWGTIN